MVEVNNVWTPTGTFGVSTRGESTERMFRFGRGVVLRPSVVDHPQTLARPSLVEKRTRDQRYHRTWTAAWGWPVNRAYWSHGPKRRRHREISLLPVQQQPRTRPPRGERRNSCWKGEYVLRTLYTPNARRGRAVCRRGRAAVRADRKSLVPSP